MTEQRSFSFSGVPGLSCVACGEPLAGVRRTTHTEGFTIREHVCAKCGKLNVSHERIVLARERRGYFSGPKE